MTGGLASSPQLRYECGDRYRGTRDGPRFFERRLAFRDEVRRFIAENFDEELRAKMAQSKNGYLDKDGQLKWQRALYKKGWAAPNWPVEHGGTGWTSAQKYHFRIPKWRPPARRS